MPTRSSPGSRDTGDESSQVVRPIRSDALSPLVEAWLAEYTNPGTISAYRASIDAIVSLLDARNVADLDSAAIARFVSAYAPGKASNTVRRRLVAIRLFLRWCIESGVEGAAVRESSFKRLLASYPATYGKVQAKRNPNRLSRTDLATLEANCLDGSDLGVRDALLVRLAVAGGFRVSELLALTVKSVSNLPHVTWVGKQNRQRSAVLPEDICDLVSEYLRRYDGHTPEAPLFCIAAGPRRTMVWGTGLSDISSVRNMLNRRCGDLGYIAPHDLKRTTARILHEARSADGGHVFDLVDIADMLDHANPKITKDCYIGPLGSENKRRASDWL